MQGHQTWIGIQVNIILVFMGDQIKWRDEMYLMSQDFFFDGNLETHLELV